MSEIPPPDKPRRAPRAPRARWVPPAETPPPGPPLTPPGVIPPPNPPATPPPYTPLPPAGMPPPLPVGAVAYSAGPPTNGSAIGSLVAALVGLVLGFVCLVPFFVGGIVGVVLGRNAKREIRNSGGAQGGEGLAVSGEIIGWIDLAIGILAVVVIVALIVIGITASVHTYTY